MFSGVQIRITENKIRIRLSTDQTETEQVKMLKWIQIPQKRIQISILESAGYEI